MARAHAQTRTPKVPVRDQTRIQGEAQPRKKRPRRFYDYSLLFTIIFLTVFGLIMIYSSSYYNAQVNGQASVLLYGPPGADRLCRFVMMLVISKMNYHFFAKFTIPAIVVSYVCMLLVNFTSLGIEVNGKKRWLGTRSLRIQPAELVKVTVILVLAVIITKLGKKINEWRVWGDAGGIDRTAGPSGNGQ